MPEAKRTHVQGSHTTEFWIAVLVLILATALRLTHDVSEETWRWVVGPVVAAYIVGRSYIKAAK